MPKADDPLAIRGLPVLHDDEKVLRRSFQQLDVGERIAVQQQEIGERVPFDHTELAQIGLRGPDVASDSALSAVAILQPGLRLGLPA